MLVLKSITGMLNSFRVEVLKVHVIAIPNIAVFDLFYPWSYLFPKYVWFQSHVIRIMGCVGTDDLELPDVISYYKFFRFTTKHIQLF